MVQKGNLAVFKKIVVSPKLERPRPLKLVYMHYTTCIVHALLDYIAHGPKGKFGHF